LFFAGVVRLTELTGSTVAMRQMRQLPR